MERNTGEEGSGEFCIQSDIGTRDSTWRGSVCVDENFLFSRYFTVFFLNPSLLSLLSFKNEDVRPTCVGSMDALSSFCHVVSVKLDVNVNVFTNFTA